MDDDESDQSTSARDRAYRESMLRLTASGRLHDDGAPRAVLEEARRVFDADWAAAYLLDTASGNVALLHESGRLRGTTDPEAARLLFAVNAPTLHTLAEAPPAAACLMREHGVRWSLCAPFRGDRGRRGMLVLASAADVEPKAPDLPYLASFAGLFGLTVHIGRPSPGATPEESAIARIGERLAAATPEESIAAAAEAIAEALGTTVAIYLLADGHIDIGAVAARPGTGQDHAEYLAEAVLQRADNAVERMLLRAGDRPTMLTIDADDDRALHELGCSGMAVAVLVAAGQRIGAVAAFREAVGPADDRMRADPERLLPRLARAVAPSIQNTLLRGELRATARETEALRRINLVAWQSRDIEESIETVAGSIRLLLDADYVAFFEVRGGAASWMHVLGSRLSGQQEPPRPAPNEWVRDRIARLQPGVIRRLGEDPPVPAAEFPLLTAEGVVSGILVPFRLIGGARGTMLVGFRREQPITAGDVRFARALAHSAVATQMIRRLHEQRGGPV